MRLLCRPFTSPLNDFLLPTFLWDKMCFPLLTRLHSILVIDQLFTLYTLKRTHFDRNCCHCEHSAVKDVAVIVASKVACVSQLNLNDRIHSAYYAVTLLPAPGVVTSRTDSAFCLLCYKHDWEKHNAVVHPLALAIDHLVLRPVTKEILRYGCYIHLPTNHRPLHHHLYAEYL